MGFDQYHELPTQGRCAGFEQSTPARGIEELGAPVDSLRCALHAASRGLRRCDRRRLQRPL